MNKTIIRYLDTGKSHRRHQYNCPVITYITRRKDYECVKVRIGIRPSINSSKNYKIQLKPRAREKGRNGES